MRNINLDATRIAKLQTESMKDLCVITSYSDTQDSYGEPQKSISGSVISICGVRVGSGAKTYDDSQTFIKNETVIRLPLSTTITEEDTITITRQNNVVTNISFGVANISVGSGELIVKTASVRT